MRSIMKTLRIGHKDYTLDIVDLNYHGITDHNKNYIHLSKLLSNSEIVATLIHEITHALVWHFGRHEDENIKEEAWCDLMGNGWTMVYRDNPWLMQFITSKLKKV